MRRVLLVFSCLACSSLQYRDNGHRGPGISATSPSDPLHNLISPCRSDVRVARLFDGPSAEAVKLRPIRAVRDEALKEMVTQPIRTPGGVLPAHTERPHRVQARREVRQGHRRGTHRTELEHGAEDARIGAGSERIVAPRSQPHPHGPFLDQLDEWILQFFRHKAERNECIPLRQRLREAVEEVGDGAIVQARRTHGRLEV